MRPGRPFTRLLVAVVAILALAAGLAQFASASPALRPSLVRECGSIAVGGESFAVDVAEARGRGPKGCGVARAVMGKFLRRSPGPYEGPNNETVRYRGRDFSCYVSRGGDEGWAYVCGWHSSGARRYVYYGAGRLGF
jgi:hypothetical protein